MNKRKNASPILLGAALAALLTAGGLYLSRSGESNASQALDNAKSSQKLQSLAELDGKAPSHRNLNVQTWSTAEGAKVLFVEARELPMFDMRLIFAAGSSQDGNTSGLALLTNAMLNEGVAGKDVGAIAQGFESLGADIGNGAYKGHGRGLAAQPQRGG